MPDPDPPEFVEASFRLRWQGRQVQARVPLPTVPLPPRAVLPLAQQVASAVAQLAEAAVRDRGEAVSCRAGCGTCCRQLVPVTESETRHLRDVVENLPGPRRQAVRDRFAAGRARLAAAGLREAFRDPAGIPADDRVALGVEYFRLGIPCPFLEDESCSIHPDRPTSCREYLVTSPAENCRTLSAESVRQVPLPTRVMPAFSVLDGRTPAGAVRWVPLLLALEWADAHPDDPDPTMTGPDLFARFLAELNEQKFPGSPDPVPPAEEA